MKKTVLLICMTTPLSMMAWTSEELLKNVKFYTQSIRPSLNVILPCSGIVSSVWLKARASKNMISSTGNVFDEIKQVMVQNIYKLDYLIASMHDYNKQYAYEMAEKDARILCEKISSGEINPESSSYKNIEPTAFLYGETKNDRYTVKAYEMLKPDGSKYAPVVQISNSGEVLLYIIKNKYTVERSATEGFFKDIKDISLETLKIIPLDELD